VGFHPSLAELKGFWDDGMLAVVEGVGYPDQSYSHFKSMHIWQTEDQDGMLGGSRLGRYFETLGMPQAKAFPVLAVGKVLPPECSTTHLPIPVVESVSLYQLQSGTANNDLDPSVAQALQFLLGANAISGLIGQHGSNGGGHFPGAAGSQLGVPVIGGVPGCVLREGPKAVGRSHRG